MLELRIMNAGTAVPLFDLPAALGRNQAAREIGDTIESLIAFMDDLGGDPDLEETDAEDAFQLSPRAAAFADGPGCVIADQDLNGDESGEPAAWIEWHTRGSHRLEYGGERLARDRAGNPLQEDHEDDDPDTSVEDGPEGFDPEEDFGAEERGEQEEPPEEFCSLEARTEQRDRIRQTRCDRLPGYPYRSFPTYRYRLRA